MATASIAVPAQEKENYKEIIPFETDSNKRISR